LTLAGPLKLNRFQGMARVRWPVDWPYSYIHLDIRLGLVEPDWAGSCEAEEFGE